MASGVVLHLVSTAARMIARKLVLYIKYIVHCTAAAAYEVFSLVSVTGFDDVTAAVNSLSAGRLPFSKRYF